jgi:hypothetical protein
MGQSLQNLDGMIRAPYGCGEQNMISLKMKKKEKKKKKKKKNITLSEQLQNLIE